MGIQQCHIFVKLKIHYKNIIIGIPIMPFLFTLTCKYPNYNQNRKYKTLHLNFCGFERHFSQWWGKKGYIYIYTFKAKLSPKPHSNIQKIKEKIAQTFLECWSPQ